MGEVCCATLVQPHAFALQLVRGDGTVAGLSSIEGLFEVRDAAGAACGAARVVRSRAGAPLSVQTSGGALDVHDGGTRGTGGSVWLSSVALTALAAGGWPPLLRWARGCTSAIELGAGTGVAGRALLLHRALRRGATLLLTDGDPSVVQDSLLRASPGAHALYR